MIEVRKRAADPTLIYDLVNGEVAPEACTAHNTWKRPPRGGHISEIPSLLQSLIGWGQRHKVPSRAQVDFENS